MPQVQLSSSAHTLLCTHLAGRMDIPTWIQLFWSCVSRFLLSCRTLQTARSADPCWCAGRDRQGLSSSSPQQSWASPDPKERVGACTDLHNTQDQALDLVQRSFPGLCLLHTVFGKSVADLGRASWRCLPGFVKCQSFRGSFTTPFNVFVAFYIKSRVTVLVYEINRCISRY